MRSDFIKGSKGCCVITLGSSCAQLVRAVAFFMGAWMVSGLGFAEGSPCMAVGVDSIVKVISSSFEGYGLPDSEHASYKEDTKKRLERCLASHVVCTLISDSQEHEMWSEQDDFQPTEIDTNYAEVYFNFMIIQFVEPQSNEPLCMVVKGPSWFDKPWDVARWEIRPSGVHRLLDKQITFDEAKTPDQVLKVIRSRYAKPVESTSIDTQKAS